MASSIAIKLLIGFNRIEFSNRLVGGNRSKKLLQHPQYTIVGCKVLASRSNLLCNNLGGREADFRSSVDASAAVVFGGVDSYVSTSS